MKRIGNELANLDEQFLCDLVNIVKIYTWKISDNSNNNNNNETVQSSPLKSNPSSKQTRLSDFNVS